MAAEINRRFALRRRGVPNMARMVHPLAGKPPTGNMAYIWRTKILDRKRRLQRDARSRIAQQEMESGRQVGLQFDGDRDNGPGAPSVVAGEQVPEQGGELLTGMVENASFESAGVSPEGTEQTGKVGG